MTDQRPYFAVAQSMYGPLFLPAWDVSCMIPESRRSVTDGVVYSQFTDCCFGKSEGAGRGRAGHLYAGEEGGGARRPDRVMEMEARNV